MKRNTELLEQIAERIESEPEHWNQAWFENQTACGTTYCIGGWAAFLSGERADRTDSHRAAELLGLEYEDGQFIFFNGMGHDQNIHPQSHKETAEWLRAIGRGEDVVNTAPEWWVA